MSKQRTVRVLRRAEQDLREAREYIAIDRPDSASRVIDCILDAIERLGRFPHGGPVPRDGRLKRLGYRYLSVDDYLVFYKVIPRWVRIYRVLHAKRAYWRIL